MDPQAYLKWIDLIRFQEQELTSDVILLFLNKKLTSSQLIFWSIIVMHVKYYNWRSFGWPEKDTWD